MILDAEFNISEADFQRLSEVVHGYCGINLRDGKQQLVRARLAKRLRARGFHCVSEYLDLVLADASGEEFTLLIDALSTNLTSFYREPDHFRYLADMALPQLIKQKRARGQNRIRLWSAGCSSGEEPYTLAMILLDSIPDRAHWDIKILATDISTRVLKVCRCGFYGKARLDTLPGDYRQRFFEPCELNGERGFSAAQPLREIICFRRLNLMENWPFSGPLDFIFCRNVMIYFDKPTQQRLVNRFWEVLAPGGLLFTGHSESLTGIDHRFRYIRPTIYGKA